MSNNTSCVYPKCFSNCCNSYGNCPDQYLDSLSNWNDSYTSCVYANNGSTGSAAAVIVIVLLVAILFICLCVFLKCYCYKIRNRQSPTMQNNGNFQMVVAKPQSTIVAQPLSGQTITH
jgi:hypothetical protein